MSNIFNNILEYLSSMPLTEILGLIFGLLAVIYLVRESIWTWPWGIAYCLVSFVVFWQERLYGDLLLHIFFFVLNIYGWYYWIHGKPEESQELPITNIPQRNLIIVLVFSAAGIFLFGYGLENLTDASVPYWDSATSILSVAAMWMTTRKRIENWFLWLIIDILATGIYVYKEMYFYALLYFIYIGLAVAGYLEWKKIQKAQPAY